ncbi:type II toxin-antitoxin system CcdA family antitoxin [uncultured Sphingomonas sp.]|uniref:type II toxin-antitoxin system CcdA family antitoxin n=1 Tax=uncultured Sphingomonas sp. TaxID=158754 RepID=UPI0025F6BE54|nr:type II toxin-antitoxin system CcdA family antitoxin [uncultured Sphingomonas sp.]
MTSSTPDSVALDPALVARAQGMGIDIAATCHAALLRAIEEAALAGLRAETAAAIAEWNDWAGTPE